MALTDIDGARLDDSAFYAGKNLIINGAMRVAQRGTQVTGVTTQGYRTCDRFDFNPNALGTWTVDQDTNAPNGFANSFKVTCTTADASPASGDYLILQHFIEAANLQSLGFGTSAAKATTLSFWVKSNKTGNASIAIRQPDNSNKQVTYQYSISTADTWEYKTIAIPADTSGVINNDTGQGLKIEWWLNSGSDYTGGSHRSTWTAADNTDRNVSNFGLGGATSDYWQITGVQLEVGASASAFEHRSYGDELERCKRYFQAVGTFCSGFIEGTTFVAIAVPFHPEMRATPSISAFAGKTARFRDNATDLSISSPTLNNTSVEKTGVWTRVSTSGRTNGNPIVGRMNGADADFIAANAEL